MEIKHTIEILTKDIQDIEKLIGKLKNYSSPPQIELDLAMSKLRRVYEIIYMISNDRSADISEMLEDGKKSEETPDQESKAEAHDQELQATDMTHDITQPVQENPETLEAPVADPVIEDANDVVEREINGEESQEEHLIDSAGEVKEEASETVSETAEAGEESKAAEPPLEPELPLDAPIEKKESKILAEKFAKDQSLNERIAGGKAANVDTAIKGGPIDSIKRNIGINDRFLIIRELMNGDNEGFNQLLLKLDECNNFNDAFKKIEARFPENLEHEGVKILINLSRRKFISSGNV